MDKTVVKNIQENYRRIYIEMLFLLLLTKEDMYGFQLNNELNKLSGGVFDIKQGSLYAPIYRLIDNGYISEKKVTRGKRRVLSYYHIEPEGYKYLNYLLETENTVLNAIDAVKSAVNYTPEANITNSEQDSL